MSRDKLTRLFKYMEKRFDGLEKRFDENDRDHADMNDTIAEVGGEN